ncbi:MAG TPA: hypothetical protein GX527_00680 [Clostridiaceae bacterium]|jgi:hypothetical protein|nr:hypothetical protein [Clostridiaceae bacterium]
MSRKRIFKRKDREEEGREEGEGSDLLMKRRIIAWTLLIGFILLLLNILVIGYKRDMSIVIYLIIAFLFIITMRRNEKQE